MPDSLKLEAARLVLSGRWAALATLEDGAPAVSMVAYAPFGDLSRLLLHLSGLARHTKNLLDDPRASLAISLPDNGSGDPQELARVSLRGEAMPLDESTDEWATARELYVGRFPASEMRFELPDFFLFEFRPEQVMYVGGFGRALRLTADQLRTASRELAAEEPE